MNTKALILLASIVPIICGTNMLARKCATESRQNSDSTASVSRFNDVCQDAAEVTTTAEQWDIIGLVVAARIVDVRSQTNGVIDNLSKSVGDSIESSQALATLDSAELVLEAQSQQARLASAGHRVTAAEIDLKMLQEQEAHMRQAQNVNAASAFEVSQLRRQVESAAAKLKGLQEDFKEQQVAARSIERQMNKYRCLSPISGRIIEMGAVKGGYVREGQLLAKIQSAQQHVNVSLSADLIERLQSITLRTQQRGGWIILTADQVAPNCNLDGSRCVCLAIPAGCDLIVGQTLHIQVSTKP